MSDQPTEEDLLWKAATDPRRPHPLDIDALRDECAEQMGHLEYEDG